MTKLEVGAGIVWKCPNCKSSQYDVKYENQELTCICLICHEKQVVVKITENSITVLKSEVEE